MSEAAASLALMQNVRDLRQRLANTESSLKKITRLQAEVGDAAMGYRQRENQDQLSIESERYSGPTYPPLFTSGFSSHRDSNDDFGDRESVRSGLSTIPDSYTGFVNRQFPSSTPNRQQVNQDLLEEYGSGNINNNHPKYDTSKDSEENSRKMMRQNQRLLAEVEKQAYELQSADSKIRELTREMSSQRELVPELEDKIIGLQAETEAQDKALRSAEERCDSSQQELANVQKKFSQSQRDLEELQAEVIQERKLRKKIESQRDDALQTFLDSQDTLEEYQKKMKDKVKRLEGNEDYLRDNLQQANAEREELLERVTNQQAQLDHQEVEIQRLQALEAVELETKTDIEQQNLELRDNINRITTRFNDLERELTTLESVRRENMRLKAQLQSQQQQLNSCQDEMEESRTVLRQLEQLAAQIQHSQSPSANISADDSGTASMNQMSSPGRHNSSVSFSKQASNSRNESRSVASGGVARSLLSDLRLRLSMKDAEIQRLQTCLHARDRDNPAVMIEGLRTELATVMDKNKQGSLKSQELETVIGRLESDRAKLVAQIGELRRDVGDKDAQMASLESRLTLRNSQIIEFQEDINKKSTEVNTLEREVRKKTSQISSLEEQLDEKMREFSAHIARMKQLEEEIISREEEVDEIQHKLAAQQSEMRKLRSSGEKSQQLHKEQCRDYEKQIDILQGELEKTGRITEDLRKQLDKLKEDTQEKSLQNEHLEKNLQETREELSIRTQQSQSALLDLEEKAMEGNGQIKQLESSLLLCREEIKGYLTTLEETTASYERERALQEQRLSRALEELVHVKSDLREKTETNMEMEKSLMESQLLLQQSSNRITELEESNTDLNRQVPQLEQRLLKAKAQSMTELETVERKLHQACSDMETKSAEVIKFNQTIRDLREDNRHLSSEISSLEHQLQDGLADSEDQAARIVKLEKNNRDLRVELEQKIELVNDMEDQMSGKAEDAQQQMNLINDLEGEIAKLKSTVKEGKSERCKLDDELQRLKFEVKAKDDMLEDMRDGLKKAQDEMCMLRDENEDLKTALDERQTELRERVAQVTKLDQTIKETHTEMEQRMMKLDSTLQKYQAEIQERTRQIANLDDTLQQTQVQLKEKTLQYQHTDQMLQRNTMELQAKSAKLDELEKVTERQQHRLDDQKEENVDVTQELRLTREQLQQQHGEFMETRRELAQSRRECDRFARELEETVSIARGQETNIVKLEEQLRTFHARETQTETTLKTEIQGLKKQIEELEVKHKEELSNLQGQLDVKLQEFQKLEGQLSQAIQLQEQLETEHGEELEKVQDDLDCLQNELIARKEVIDTANETIVLKEAEIARLQAKVSGFERAALSQIYTGNVQLQVANTGQRILPSSGTIIKQTVRQADPISPQKLAVQIENQVAMGIPQGYKEFYNVPGSSIMFETFQDGQSQSDEHLFQGMLVEAAKEQSSVSQGAVRTLNFDSITDSDNQTLDQNRNVKFSKGRAQPPGQRPDFPVVHDDPMTAVGVYTEQSVDQVTDVETSSTDPEQCMIELHERLRSNEARQQEIERQLQDLANDDNQ